jgi:hypothetical protein
MAYLDGSIQHSWEPGFRTKSWSIKNHPWVKIWISAPSAKLMLTIVLTARLTCMSSRTQPSWFLKLSIPYLQLTTVAEVGVRGLVENLSFDNKYVGRQMRENRTTPPATTESEEPPWYLASASTIVLRVLRRLFYCRRDDDASARFWGSSIQQTSSPDRTCPTVWQNNKSVMEILRAV